MAAPQVAAAGGDAGVGADQQLHREQVLDRLWPDLEPASAARNLHQTLYVARQAVTGGADSTGLLTIRDELVILTDEGPVDVDVLEFEQAVADALASEDEERLHAALDRIPVTCCQTLPTPTGYPD